MPRSNPSYFGVRMGEALAAGAGHISNALQRKYEMQREDELRQEALTRQQKQQDVGTQAAFALKGYKYDPNNIDPAQMDAIIADVQKKANLDRQMQQAQIGALNRKDSSLKAPSGFRYTEAGDLEAIPGGPAFIKQDKSKALGQVSNVLSEIRTYYNELQQRGGIVDVTKGGMSNIGAKIGSSKIGQATGGMLGTETQSIRQKILSSRPLLINFIRQASNMGARGLDSEKELEFYLSAATDPTKDVQSNMAAIQRLDEAYGLGSMMVEKSSMGGQQGGSESIMKDPRTGKRYRIVDGKNMGEI